MNNRDIVSRFITSALSGDRPATAALTHPEFFIVEAGSLPYGGTYAGAEGLFRMLAGLAAAFDHHTVELRSIIGEPEAGEFGVLVEMSGSKGGRPFRMSVFERWVVRDGKVAEIWPYYWDTKAIADL